MCQLKQAKHKLQSILPRSALPTLYNCFTRSPLDLGDIIFDQFTAFHQTFDLIQWYFRLNSGN